MLGVVDPLYIAARSTLLDALTALREHLPAVVLVGAQAVYLQAGEGDLAVAPFTTDGDLAIDPRTLASEPLIEVALRAAEFHSQKGSVGVWNRTVNVGGVSTNIPVDLLIPDSLGGPGRRAARIPPHASNSARRVTGLEAALVDNDRFTISALDAADTREFQLSVAGPSALLVAKVHKIFDRIESPDRLRDKDALDIYRLLRVVQTATLVSRFQLLLENGLSRSSTQRAIDEIPRFSHRLSNGRAGIRPFRLRRHDRCFDHGALARPHLGAWQRSESARQSPVTAPDPRASPARGARATGSEANRWLRRHRPRPLGI
jgi:hypothetical protein